MNSRMALAHLRKSESVSGHVPGLCILCEYHFLDTINIGNNEFRFLIFDKFQPTSVIIIDIIMSHAWGPGLVS